MKLLAVFESVVALAAGAALYLHLRTGEAVPTNTAMLIAYTHLARALVYGLNEEFMNLAPTGFAAHCFHIAFYIPVCIAPWIEL